MHTMKSDSRRLTIIALIFEGIASIGFLAIALGLFLLSEFSLDFILDIILSDGADTLEPIAGLDSIMLVVIVLFTIVGTIVLPIFIFNLLMFSKLLRGKFSDQAAKRLYLYQMIYGGLIIIFSFSLLLVPGICYLLSGYKGKGTIKF
ncbi:MAG: hypothetical protein ACOCU1_01860 [Bacillota bacterium]